MQRVYDLISTYTAVSYAYVGRKGLARVDYNHMCRRGISANTIHDGSEIHVIVSLLKGAGFVFLMLAWPTHQGSRNAHMGKLR